VTKKQAMATQPEPVGFFSYVHDDDTHEDGRLTQLYQRLVGEIRMHTGEHFEIFHDRDIRWREQWRQRIDGALDLATFLFPVITPAFFHSAECRRELEQFLNVERRRRRDDLIFPIYYFNCPLLNNPERRKNDVLAQTVADRQYFDLREYRFEPFTSPALGRLLANMVAQVVEALEHDSPERVSASLVEASTGRAAARPEALPMTSDKSDQPSGPGGPSEKTEPPTHIVDQLSRGHFTNIASALASAKPGDRIVVRPGLYREALIVDKVVEIIGDGELGTVRIEATRKSTIFFKATGGRIANLTLRHAGGGKWFCVDIAQGRLHLEDCDIASQSLACVAIHGGADPWLRRNRIHDGKQGGVYIYENGQGVIEDNEIFANALSGVGIKNGGNPTVRRNRIHDGKQSGIFVYENGQGVIEDNEIFANAFSGIAIGEKANPVVRGNSIYGSKRSGVIVRQDGQGVIEDNDIFANDYAGIATATGGNPTVRVNRITKNEYEAVWVYEGGRGTFEGNDLRGNKRGAWDIEDDCVEHVIRKDNTE
jgi:parallel beta-helix repeat protein